MWKLNCPNIGLCSNELERGITPARGPTLYSPSAAERDTISALYVSYMVNFGRPIGANNDTTLPAALLNAIQAAYSSTRGKGRLKDLRSRIMATTDRCTYCGNVAPNHLDHHLSQSDYQVFAIFALNLVPSCDTCNGSKPRNTYPDPERQFCNPYLEPISTDPFLWVMPDVGEQQITFRVEIRRPANIEGSTFSRITYQFQSLDLESRISRLVLPFVFEQRFTFMSLLNLDATLIEGALRSEISRYAMRVGHNHWQTALWRGLLETPVATRSEVIRLLSD